MRLRKTSQYFLDRAAKFIEVKFGKLTVKEITSHRDGSRNIIVKCLCDCGSEHLAKLTLLKRGAVKSCGCLPIESCLNNLKKAQAVAFKRAPRLGSAKRVFDNNYADGDLTLEEFVELSQQTCFYCGKEPSARYNAYQSTKASLERKEAGWFIYNGLDRVDNNLGHMKSNLVPCCWDCNRAKLARPQEEFLNWIDKVYKLHFIK